MTDAQGSCDGDAAPSATEERRVRAPDLCDADLCDWIENDARELVAQGEVPGLDRYLEAIAELEMRPVALDAALSAVMRYSMRSGLSREDIVATLVSNHPRLESAIHACDLLDEAMVGPEASPEEPLPRELGPLQRDGRGRYQLIELLDSGVQGRVYRAVDRMLSDEGRPAVVAVKVARAGGAVQRNEALREAVRAKRVDHENVVRVLDAGDAGGGRVYVVFDYVDGQTLWDWRERRSDALSHREAARIVRDLACGLAASHRAGLYHLDIHPRNVLMRQGDRPTLVDFGCGRSILEAGEPFWRGRGALGFIAPESYREDSGVPPHLSDVYATGAILYWLLSGRFANGESEAEVEKNLGAESARSDPPMAGDAAPRIDPDLEAIVARALQPDPARRTASADAMVQDLDRYLAREPLQWREQSVPRRLSLWVQRSPARAAGLSLGAIGAILGAAIATGATIEAQNVRQREALERQLVEQRSLARVQEAELIAAREAAERLEQSSAMVASLQRFINTLTAPQATEKWIAALTYINWLSADERLALPEVATAARQKRLEFASERLERLLRDPGASRLELLLQAGATGALYLEAERFDEAAAALNSAASIAESLLREEDAVFRQLDVLRTIATAKGSDADAAAAARERLAQLDRTAIPAWTLRYVEPAVEAVGGGSRED